MNLSNEGEEEFMVPDLQREEGSVDLRKEFPDTAEGCVSVGCLLSQERFARMIYNYVKKGYILK